MDVQEKYPNRLRHLRKQRGWKQQRVIFELEREAAARGAGIANRASLKTELSRWENGHKRVGPEYRPLFCAVYSCTEVDLGIAPEAQAVSVVAADRSAFLNDWYEAASGAAEEWSETVRRRDFMRGTATYTSSTSVAPALSWLLRETEAPIRAGSVAVGEPHLDGIKELTLAYRRTDNRYGGAYARESLIRFLANELKPLITDGRYDSATGRRLFSAGAEAVQLAGWMSYDSGMHGTAQKYMNQALRLAAIADDALLGCEILCGLSHQASYLKDGVTAVEVARVARRTALGLGAFTLAAEALVMEAHGHACLGDARRCADALASAERMLDQADRSDDPSWIAYFDEAYLSAKIAHCFRELREARSAATYAEKSLVMNMTYVRGRIFNLCLYSSALAQIGEVGEAVALGRQAVELAEQMQSHRVKEYLASMRAELTPYRDMTEVRSLLALTGSVQHDGSQRHHGGRTDNGS